MLTVESIRPRDLPVRAERQVFPMKKLRLLLPVLLIAALLLCACGAPTVQPTEPTPAESETPVPVAEPSEESLPEGAVLADSIDAFLSALGSGNTIVLEEGEYDLSSAYDYGASYQNRPYTWRDCYDGYELVIRDLEDLRISCRGSVKITALPRYACALNFENCVGLSLEGFTLGHREMPSVCSGGVLDLKNCRNVQVSGCGFFGCGVTGLIVEGCENVSLDQCEIYECSDSAVNAYSFRDLRLSGCRIYDCGLGGDPSASQLFNLTNGYGFGLVNSQVSNCHAQGLLYNYRSGAVSLLGCRVEGNRFSYSVFSFQGQSALVDKCSFSDNGSAGFYTSSDKGLFAHDPSGEDLISFDLDRMQWAEAEYAGPPVRDAGAAEGEQLPDGSTLIHVSSVDGLLESIGSNVTIELEPGLYSMSSASNYGAYGGDNYYWADEYDGPCLVIQGVENFHIRGTGREECSIETEPRYADVLRFIGCENVSLSGLTLGHSLGAGMCAGDALNFQSSGAIRIEDCGLFGCGVYGLNCDNCRGVDVRNTELYECSAGGAVFFSCREVSFSGCSIRDCDDGRNTIELIGTSVEFDGRELSDGMHLFSGSDYKGLWEP